MLFTAQNSDYDGFDRPTLTVLRWAIVAGTLLTSETGVTLSQDDITVLDDITVSDQHSVLVSIQPAKVDECSADDVIADHTRNELCSSYAQL